MIQVLALGLVAAGIYAMFAVGIVLNQRDKHKEAIVQFEKAMDMGEGTYDLFAYYADSLAKLGRTAEARAEFERAAAMTQNARERTLLLKRAADCTR